MQCPDGTTLGIHELQQSLLFGRGLHGLLSEAASDIQFSCSHGISPASVTLTCLGERPLVVTFSREGSVSILHTGEALELKSGQDARIDVEGAEHGYTFRFGQDNLAGNVTQHPGPVAPVSTGLGISSTGLPAQPLKQLLTTHAESKQSHAEEGPSRKRARLSDGAELPAEPAAGRTTAAADIGGPPPGPPPAFSLLRVRGLAPEHSSGMLGARLADVLGGGHVRWMLISNYMLDLGWLLSAVPSILAAEQVILVHGERNNPPAVRMMMEASRGRGWTVHAPPLRDQWGVHHSKAFLVEFERGVRVIVMTANLIFQDCNLKTQGLWYQDFPRKTEGDGTASSFGAALADYLAALRLPAQAAEHARKLVREHDFSSARAHLIPSVPGYHTGADMRRHGHMRVRDLLSREDFSPDFRHAPLVAQFSSMGSINPKWLEELQHSFSQGSCTDPDQPARPLGKPEDFRVVWPTVAAVRDSNEGWYAGGSIPGSATNVLRAAKGSTEPMLKQHWCVWDGRPAAMGRQHAMPHIKTYLRHRDQKIAYLVVTSHNLSKAAWGALQKNETQLYIMHFELGVLLLPSLEEAYRRHEHYGFSCTALPPEQGMAVAADDPAQRVQFWAKGSADMHATEAADTGACIVELPVPYELPPQRYQASDEPWRVGEAFSGLDSQGCTIQESFECNSHYGHEEPAG